MDESSSVSDANSKLSSLTARSRKYGTRNGRRNGNHDHNRSFQNVMFKSKPLKQATHETHARIYSVTAWLAAVPRQGRHRQACRTKAQGEHTPGGVGGR